MFGAYRTFLALMVATGHLFGPFQLGTYAVFGFYVLSGFLMTLIMHESYGYSLQGIGRYVLNRILRIYPAYWAACLISAALILFFSVTKTVEYHESMYLPQNAGEFFRNLFIIFIKFPGPRLVPPAWALTIELIFYILIALGISRNLYVCLLWLAASLAYTVYINLQGMEWQYRYFGVFAASLPFSLGACSYLISRKYRGILKLFDDGRIPVALFAVMCVNFLSNYYLGTVSGSGFYINLVIVVLMVISLSDKERIWFLDRRMDKRIGGLSYPVYLVHWQCGLLVWGLGLAAVKRSLPFLLMSLPIVLVLAWAINKYIEKPIERMRGWIKARREAVLNLVGEKS